MTFSIIFRSFCLLAATDSVHVKPTQSGALQHSAVTTPVAAIRDDSSYFLRALETKATDTSRSITRTLLSNLGGVGPDVGEAPYLVYDNVGVLNDGTPFSLRLRNATEYKCLHPQDNTMQSDAPSFARLSLKAASQVKLIGEFIEARTHKKLVQVPTFWLAIAGLNADARSNLNEVVRAEPDRFWISPRAQQHVTVRRGENGMFEFSSNQTDAVRQSSLPGTSMDRAPPEDYVVLMYHARSEFELTLEVAGGGDGTSFQFLGGSELYDSVWRSAVITRDLAEHGGESASVEAAVAHPIAAQPTSASIRRLSATASRQEPSNYTRPTLQPGMTVCGSTTNDTKAGCPECIYSRDCMCTGWVRMGYGLNWTQWQPVSGYIACDAASFAYADPHPERGELCECTIYEPTSQSSTSTSEGASGWWKPIVIVCVVALPLASLLSLAHCGCIVGSGVTISVLEVAAPAAGHATMLAVAFMMSAKGIDHTLNSYAATPSNSTETFFRTSHSHAASLKAAEYPDFSQARYLNYACYTAAVAFAFQQFARLHYEYLIMRAEYRRQDLYYREPSEDYNAQRRWRKISHITMAIMYIAIIILLVGDIFSSSVVMTTAEFCAYALVVGYFGVHLVFYIISFETASRFAAAVAKLSSLNLAFAPMVGLLCIMAQVQADSVDQVVVSTQEQYMRSATAVVLLQAMLATVQPLIFSSSLVEVGRSDQEDLVMQRNRGCLFLFSVIRWVMIAYVYIACYELLTDLWSRADSTSKLRTQWVVVLAFVFFTANMVQWTVLTLRSFGCAGKHALHWSTLARGLAAPLPAVVALIVGWWILTPGAVPW